MWSDGMAWHGMIWDGDGDEDGMAWLLYHLSPPHTPNLTSHIPFPKTLFTLVLTASQPYMPLLKLPPHPIPKPPSSVFLVIKLLISI